MANWIKLYLDADKNSEYRAFEESMRSGKRGAKAKRAAEDAAFAQTIRLYMLLGQTKDGKINYKDVGERLLAEDIMRESGDDLLGIFDRMATFGVINRELWAGDNVVTTANAVEQANVRRFYKDRSFNANQAKREKAEREERERLEHRPDGKP